MNYYYSDYFNVFKCMATSYYYATYGILLQCKEEAKKGEAIQYIGHSDTPIRDLANITMK